MSKRILVVEDQPDSRQIIRDMLALTDYEITEAENGEEALAAITKPDETSIGRQSQNRQSAGPRHSGIIPAARRRGDRITG